MSTSTATSREFSLDEWIESGTVAQRTIELHNDRSIPDRLAQLEKRRVIAVQVAASAESGITDASEVAEIDDAMEALYAEWEASKETWVLRALSADEIKALQKAFRIPEGPKSLAKKATAAARTAHAQRSAVWAEQTLEIRRELDLAYITWALMRVETSRGTAHAVGAPLTLDGGLNEGFRPAATVEQLKALSARPGRQHDTTALVAAAVDATKGDVEVPAPFLQRISRTDPS